MRITPYPHQMEAVDAAFEKATPGEPSLIVLPTASGKSVITAEMCRRAVQNWGGRVLMIVRSRELCEQNLEKMIGLWPEAPVGVHSAGLGRKDIHDQILFCTIGSVHSKAHLLGRVDMLIIDEAHMVDNKEAGTYRKFISELRRYCPHLVIYGLTASPFRGNGVWLTAGENPLFVRTVYEIKMQFLMDNGFLSPLVLADNETLMRSDGISTTNGDYSIKELSEAHDRAELVAAACADLVDRGHSRKTWIVFGVTIAHCEHIRDELIGLGVDAAVISEKTPSSERKALIARHRAGNLRCLVSVNALSVGFDSPGTDLVCLMRSTKSPVFYLQSAGRGMRVSKSTSKVDCLWVDYTDTTERLGPIDKITGRLPTGGRKGEAPHKLCPNCGSQNPASATECMDCGFQFPPPERIKHGAQASAAAVLSSQRDSMFETVPVSEVRYKLHEKPGSPPSLRVEYYDGLLKKASEWCCLSHAGFARTKAERWWQQRSKIDAIPGSAQEALEWIEYSDAILRKPEAIIVTKAEKYPSIVSYHWQKEAA
jgi:DNA repair protein RadD